MGNTKNVPFYVFGRGSLNQLDSILLKAFGGRHPQCVFLIDCFYQDGSLESCLPIQSSDRVIYIDTSVEPKTSFIDKLVIDIKADPDAKPDCIIGIGGGIVMDVGKAVSNLLTNEGKAQDYQGWDLVRNPGVYKIGIPTLSGTGSEASRTCVLTNMEKGLKLGMNSDFTMFDQLILDPDLTATVARNQYFYTGMDTYLHCMESLRGSYRNAIIDALSEKAIALCRDVFLSDDMQSDENREKMMIASYMGGCAAGNVGIVHPLSAGLSIALGTHHGVANCIVMNAMEEFYPQEYAEYTEMMQRQKVDVPTGICADLSDEQYDQLYASSIIHEKPLTNALGEGFRDILTKEKMVRIFKRM